MNRSRSGYVYIVLCAVIFSTMEVMLKTVHGVFAPMQITCLRFLVGGILLIPFASRSIKKKNASLSRKDIGFFALSGFLCVVIAMSLYQMSVTYTRASIVAVIFSCNPIFVTVFAHLFLHEDIHRNHIIALILELTAALIIIDPIHATLDPTGSVLAILSAVMFALYSVFGKKRTPRFGGIAVTCLSFLFGAGELVFILLFGRTAAGASLYGAVGLNLFIDVPLFENIPASAIPALLYICCINSAAGFVCHMMAMEKTSAQEASLIFFLKPILAPIFALLFPQGGNSAQYDRRHRLLPDRIAVRDPAGDPCSTQGVEIAKISFAFFPAAAQGAIKGDILFPRKENIPFDPQEKGILIASEQLEELRRLPNQVPAKWCCYTI